MYEGSLKNNYLYQGAYSELDDDIGWHDFMLRNYDVQIGRWVQQDPYQEFASPYVGMGDDPINLTDPSGGSILDGLSGVARVAVTTLGGAIIGLAVDLISGGDGGKGLLIGAGVGLAAGLGSLVQQITLSMGISTMNVATTVINTSVKTEQAGRQANGSNVVQGRKQFTGPHAGGGENELGFGNDEDNSLDFSNEEVNSGPEPLIIGPILKWLWKLRKPIWQKGIKPASKWVWKQITTSPKKVIAQKIREQIQKKSLKELQDIVKMKSDKFRELFKTGKEGAEKVLKDIKNVKVPKGLNRVELEAYLEVTKRVVDPTGTQAVRQKILEVLLKL